MRGDMTAFGIPLRREGQPLLAQVSTSMSEICRDTARHRGDTASTPREEATDRKMEINASHLKKEQAERVS